ncbi:MAG: sodium:calcium antiporter [Candidatus Micrarchaeia archaeon]
MLQTVLVLLLSLGVLSVFAERIVVDAIKITRFLRIGEVAAGFVLISISVSIPELTVAIMSSVMGESAIAVGNVIGSNMVDMCIILGICALIRTIYIREHETEESIKLLFALAIIPLALLLRGGMGRAEGFLLILVFIAYLYLVSRERVGILHGDGVTRAEATRSFVHFIISLGVVMICAFFVVSSAVELARILKLDKSFMGATVIALGTALPELAINAAAVRRGRFSLAFGEIFGSAMTNMTLVLGVSAIIHPATIDIMIFSAILTFFVITTITLLYLLETKRKLEPSDGVLLIVIYMLFMLVSFGVEFTISGVR